jgi:hypothetical protein
MNWKLVAGIAALLTVAGGVANAANLVNRGGTSDVPTLENRIYYIKPAGAACPASHTCFCDTGTNCRLPFSGTITGTVVIDRPGVTLDCQNRTIQAPRFANSKQQCSADSQCGEHSSSGVDHLCVNGYCQLNNLAGINIGGPLEVDDGSINIDVSATGYVQDVTIVNCVVKSFASGYQVDGSEGDNGLDRLEVFDSTLRGNFRGMSIENTDGTHVRGNNVRDNYWDGMFFFYNWSLTVVSNTVTLNPMRQILVNGRSTKPNRWLDITGNLFQSTTVPANSGGMETVSIWQLEATAGGQCDPASACDLFFDRNEVRADNRLSPIAFAGGNTTTPTVALMDNRLLTRFGSLGIMNDVVFDNFQVRARCWEKGNVCFHGGFPTECAPWDKFAPGDCWF